MQRSGTDVFVVRDHAADEAPRVVMVIDRRPAMALYPEPLPWLAKRDALREAVDAIADQRRGCTGRLAALDFGGGVRVVATAGRRDRRWLIAEREGGETPFAAPDDTLERSLDVPRPPSPRTCRAAASCSCSPTSSRRPPRSRGCRAVGHGWDVIPVLIQDPVWERSFPAVGGVAVPVGDPRRGAVRAGSPEPPAG